MRFLLSWVLNALALLLVAYLIPDIHVTGLDVALVAAVVIVINGFLFWGVGHYLQGFEVRTVFAGIIGALAYSMVAWVLASLILGKRSSRRN